jgi:hypothetical protein
MTSDGRTVGIVRSRTQATERERERERVGNHLKNYRGYFLSSLCFSKRFTALLKPKISVNISANGRLSGEP